MKTHKQKRTALFSCLHIGLSTAFQHQMNCSFFLPHQRQSRMKIFQQNVFKELSKSCNTGRQERRCPRNTQFSSLSFSTSKRVIFRTTVFHRYCREFWSVLTHSLNERWLMSMMCQTLCHLPHVCRFVRSSHYTHLTDEKNRAQRWNDLSKFSQTVVELGFELESDSKTLSDSFNAPCCPPWETHQESLTSHYGAGGRENDAAYTAVPGWRLKLRQRANPRASGHPMFSLVCIFDHEKERDLPEGQTYHHPARAGLQETTRASHKVCPHECNQRSQLWWDMHLRKSVMDLTDHSQAPLRMLKSRKLSFIFASSLY